MPIIDHQNLLTNITKCSPVILELGCGPRKKIPEAIGIDAIDYEGVDIVGDVFEILERIPQNTVDELHSFHFFEHIQDLPKLVEEVSRVLKPGGKLVCVVPHFTNPYFYSDYTHKQFFGLYSFSYLSIDRFLKRKVPNYKNKPSLELLGVKLIFTSPFRGRKKIKKIIEKIVNFNVYTTEFYEENLCHIFPCYEIRYQLHKIDLHKHG
ncbi:class I SAM-dependent methyltransferase [Candidatus Nitrotoga sp. 1052]|uniref:class I SAM-dependent methyltransferase n=1 Tax=Candidatus Nitrotoga sp. 1052 TaxID=2886964 RepID=UPI001EF5DB4E|nr:methyltransferase domain-containing protein [Candidatus Nitrotoga sp. 1052]CAH1087196.1 Methyltransferase type 11 [Candidatus Nitrotoga sp. 1052]